MHHGDQLLLAGNETSLTLVPRNVALPVLKPAPAMLRMAPHSDSGFECWRRQCLRRVKLPLVWAKLLLQKGELLRTSVAHLSSTPGSCRYSR